MEEGLQNLLENVVEESMYEQILTEKTFGKKETSAQSAAANRSTSLGMMSNGSTGAELGQRASLQSRQRIVCTKDLSLRVESSHFP